MDGAAYGHRGDFEIETGILRIAVLHFDTPLAVGHGDFAFTLRPPAVYVLAMHQHPEMRITRQTSRTCDNTAPGNAISAMGRANLDRAA